MDASVGQFCATAKARLQACSDFDGNRQFLVAHVEWVIFPSAAHAGGSTGCVSEK